MEEAEITIKTFEYPPNYQEIRSFLPLGNNEIIFSYYPYIYNPNDVKIPADLMLHEQVHLNIQKQMGTGKWWTNYLHDESFRYEQELIAFATQYAYGLKIFKRKISDQMLNDFASHLSDGIYGKHKTFSQVYTDIRYRAKQYNNPMVQ